MCGLRVGFPWLPPFVLPFLRFLVFVARRLLRVVRLACISYVCLMLFSGVLQFHGCCVGCGVVLVLLVLLVGDGIYFLAVSYTAPLLLCCACIFARVR